VEQSSSVYKITASLETGLETGFEFSGIDGPYNPIMLVFVIVAM
jgi:hypothetical protein